MDTPESDISAIESGEMEPLPTYTLQDDGQDSFDALLATLASPTEIGEQDTAVIDVDPTVLDEITKNQDSSRKPLLCYPEPSVNIPYDAVLRAKQTIVTGFFFAIAQSQDEVIALFLSKNLVTANTTNHMGKTPLLAAIETRNINIVKQLLNDGGDPNAFGVIGNPWDSEARCNTKIKRTPLMLASSIGHLALVKLLIEVYHADDSLIAPDGQIALRLASANGHREIVDYLPVRRGGGFLRWQTEHRKALRRAKKALRAVFKFCKFFVWDIEKFFLWTLPKEFIAEPLAESCKWCWEHRKGFGPWCAAQAEQMAAQAKQMPARVKMFGKWVWRGVKKVPKAAGDAGKAMWEFSTKTLKKVPKAVGDAVKAMWEFSTETLPKAIKELGLWCWNLVTKRIPHAIAILSKWIWGGVCSTAKALWDILIKALSFIHTALSAVLTFFRDLKLSDVWDGFCSLLHSIFVTFPMTLVRWVGQFGEVSYKVMKAMFGGLGQCVWWIIVAVGWLVVYVPKKLWTVLCSLGSSFASGMHEIWVWFSPKA